MSRGRFDGESAAREELGHERRRPPWLEREHRLPFGLLADDEFEVFCYLLLLREYPNDRIYYYGKTGDAGRDIVHHRADGTIDLVQCKRYGSNVGINDVKSELAKLCANLHSGLLTDRFDRVVFYVATDLSAPAQDLLKAPRGWQQAASKSLRDHLGAVPSAALRAFAKSWRPRFEWETGLKLTARALSHPDLVEEFFATRKVVDASALSPLLDLSRETRAKVDTLLARSDVPRTIVPSFEGPGGGPALPVPRFFGRESELAALRDALRGESASVGALVTGLGGVGKTALVHHFVATLARDLFPDGVWWLNAHALTTELQRMLRQLGRADVASLPEDEVRATLARDLHELRALVVLDDVDPSEVDPRRLLLPGGRSRTVCTSRITTLGEQIGASITCVALGCWDLHTAREYLRSAPAPVSTSDGELEALAEHVGRLPLALQLLTWWLRRRGVTIEALRAKLSRDSLGTLDRFAKEVGRGVAETFLVTFESLSFLERTVLLSLAACAQGTSAATVAAVAGTSLEEAIDALGELFERSLVEHTENADHPWGVHDLVRLFLQAQERAEDYEVAHRNYFRKRLEALWRADATLQFDELVPEALAATDRALARSHWREAWEILATVEQRLRRSERHAELVIRYERMLALMPSDEPESGVIAGNLGLCYRSLAQYERSATLLTRALESATRLKDRREEATQLSNLAICESVRGHTHRALDLSRRSFEIAVELGEARLAVSALSNLSTCYMTLGALPDAATNLQKALTLAERHGWKDEQSTALTNLGICERRLGRIPEAIALFERVLALEEQLGSVSGVAGAHGNLGNCYGQLEDSPRALEHLQTALSIVERSGREDGIANAHSNLGTWRASRGEFHLAIGHFQRSMEIDVRLGRPEGQALTLGNLGHTYLLTEDYVRATTCLEAALALDEALGRKEGIADHLRDLGACASERGEPLRAIALLQRALTIEETLGAPERQVSVLVVLGQAYDQIGRPEKALECLKSALAKAESSSTAAKDPRVYMLRMLLLAVQAGAQSAAPPSWSNATSVNEGAPSSGGAIATTNVRSNPPKNRRL